MDPNTAPSTATAERHPTPYRHVRRPAQAVVDRTARALHHRLFLLHRTTAASPAMSAAFYVLGATGNVYTVTLSSTPSCTCPDRTIPCKHILFVLLRVLNVHLNDPLLYKKILRPCELRRLLNTPISGGAFAGARTVARFHQIFADRDRRRVRSSSVEKRRSGGGDGEEEVCPVCLEKMETGERVVCCGVCGNCLHEECLAKWKRSRGRRAASCVICRARWREKREEEESYVNLAEVMVEDLAAGESGGGGAGRGCFGVD